MIHRKCILISLFIGAMLFCSHGQEAISPAGASVESITDGIDESPPFAQTETIHSVGPSTEEGGGRASNEDAEKFEVPAPFVVTDKPTENEMTKQQSTQPVEDVEDAENQTSFQTINEQPAAQPVVETSAAAANADDVGESMIVQEEVDETPNIREGEKQSRPVAPANSTQTVHTDASQLVSLMVPLAILLLPSLF